MALAATGTSHADVVAVDMGDWTGSRTEAAGELVTLDNWIGDGISISWEITFDGSLYTYEWTLDGWSGPANGLSHTDFAVSDGRPDTVLFTEANVYPGSDPILGPEELNSGTHGAPSDMYGIRFDFGGDDPPVTYTLVTDRAPIWGSFAAKAGADSGAYNVGWGIWGDYLADTSIPAFVFDELEWIPVPDSQGRVVPEPSTIALAGLGILGLGLGALRKLRGLI
jgi:hypothetical protein